MARQRLAMLEGDLDKRRRTAGDRAEGIEEHVDDFRRGFDATDFSRQAAGAAFDDFREDHARGIRDLRGQQVGMGRLSTGFATEDEDQLTQDLHGRLSRELARGAFTAASLDLQNVGQFAGEGIEVRRAADSALAGSLDRAQAAENERQRRRRSLLGVLGGVAGGVGGFMLAGPAGAAAGARVGSQIGN